ncbi:hypothetical protein JZ751_006539 [Albula glossodonta]|uniref:Uncharacterized protein n=1 Tax=Albula glossodonta TaxID=121402 RepID=A0A8T2N5U8_9TELE|nr:hypothetical protein JZ751_006539 [Albula glossodonta]
MQTEAALQPLSVKHSASSRVSAHATLDEAAYLRLRLPEPHVPRDTEGYNHEQEGSQAAPNGPVRKLGERSGGPSLMEETRQPLARQNVVSRVSPCTANPAGPSLSSSSTSPSLLALRGFAELLTQPFSLSLGNTRDSQSHWPGSPAAHNGQRGKRNSPLRTAAVTVRAGGYETSSAFYFQTLTDQGTIPRRSGQPLCRCSVASATVDTPVSVRSVLRPQLVPSRMSVSSRSPTIMVLAGSKPYWLATHSNMNRLGFPTTWALRWAAVSTAFRRQPVPVAEDVAVKQQNSNCCNLNNCAEMLIKADNNSSHVRVQSNVDPVDLSPSNWIGTNAYLINSNTFKLLFHRIAADKIHFAFHFGHGLEVHC